MISKSILKLILPRFVTHGLGVGSAVAAAGVVVGGITGSKSAKSADKAAKAADKSADLQYDISQQQVDMAKEQWNLYKSEIFPLEQEAQRLGVDAQQLNFDLFQKYYAPLSASFAQDAMEGIKAQPERAARDARLSIDKAFDSEEGIRSRDLQRRGVMPGSGADVAPMGDISLNRAAAKGFAVNRAVEAERDRVEDVNFNRKAVALGRTPLIGGGAPGVTAAGAQYGMANAGQTARGAANTFSNLAGTYSSAAGGAVSGGIQLGMQAYDLYNKYKTPTSTATPYSSAPVSDWGYTSGNGPSAMFGSDLAFAEGGPVDVPMMGRGGMQQPNAGGMVNGPPGRDQVPAYIEGGDGSQYPARLQNEEYVIPADVVRRVGTNELDEIIARARGIKTEGKESKHALSRSGRS